MKSKLPTGSAHLEKSLFEVICLLIMLVMAHGLVQGIILYGMTTMFIVESGIVSLMGIFFYLSRFRGKFLVLRIPLVIFCNIILIYFWIALSGIYGPTGVAAISVGIISIVFLPLKYRSLFLILIMAVSVSLVFIQFHTDVMTMHPMSYETMQYDYLVVLFGTLLVVNFLKTEFDKERLRVQSQNSELGQINHSFKKNIKEKEKIISHLKKTQSQLIESEKMASLGHFTAGIAHEINNPLNFIGGSVYPIQEIVNDLKKGLPEEERVKRQAELEDLNILLGNIEKGTKHISSVLSNLLKITPRNDPSEESIEFNLREVVLDTFHLVKHASPQIEFEIKAESDIVYQGVPVEFNQILLNLLRNSIDAVEDRPGPSISVELTRDEQKIRLQVSDNGAGISPASQKKIFDPFFTTKAPGRGTGVGLYIVYTVVKKYGGNISVKSEDSKGTTFYISLPAARP